MAHLESTTVMRAEVTRFGILPATVTFRIREPGSALTHFIGLILFSVAAGPLLVKAGMSGKPGAAAAAAVYVFCTCLLYAASTAYHTIVAGRRLTTVFRKLDHASISLMIAGTYTPVCVVTLRRSGGPALLAAVWTLAAVGVLLKLFWVTCPKWLSSLVYVAMGWVCVFAIGPILGAFPPAAFLWLLAGGLLYTAGAVIYALHPKEFDARHIYFGSHEIFHVLIMLGTLCHYIVMDSFVLR